MTEANYVSGTRAAYDATADVYAQVVGTELSAAVEAGPRGTGTWPKSAVEIVLAGTVVPTASLEDIVRSKAAAGRAKDNVALPVLLRHLQRKRE